MSKVRGVLLPTIMLFFIKIRLLDGIIVITNIDDDADDADSIRKGE